MIRAARPRTRAPVWAALAVLACAAAGSVAGAETDWEADLALGSGYSTNENATTFEDPGVLHAVEARAALSPLPALTLAGAGSVYARSDVGDRESFLYELSAILGRSSEDGSVEGQASLSAGGVANGSELDVFDRREVAGELSLKWRPLRTASVLTRAGVQSTDWANLWGLDSRDFWGSLRLSTSLPTRTSLHLTFGVERREYTESLAVAQTPVPALPFASQRHRGPGKDGGSSDGGDVLASSSSSTAGGASGSSTTLRSLNLRVAQNLAAGLGVSLEGVWRGATDYLARYYEAEDLPIVDGVSPVDDRFGYRLRSAGAGLHWRLSAVHRIDVEGQVESRDYVGRAALDLDGNSLGADRADDRWEVGLDYEFTPAGLPVAWKVSCSHLSSDSNDPLYDYDRTVVLLSALVHLH
jgi:hypothetical protein